MRTINLKLQGAGNLRPIIEIDGQVMTNKIEKNGEIVVSHQTENDCVEVKVKNVLEIHGKCWWLIQMMFFIISLFGILNPRLEKNIFLLDFQAKFNISNEENEIKLKLNTPKENAKAIEVVGDINSQEETSNTYTLSQSAKKRRKILKTSYILSWIALVVIAIVVTVVVLK